ncbi:ABC transporter permease [Natrinema sp. SYSU A 869]|uniref:ABC transporter permease n=1 Tax=Natrinema sp. SYSU A 869 TaxID=2871694 RepID=UPI001CA3C2F2|nr:ABC transporter permease [Natrinema sp. SYSU A 869]
MSRLLTKGRAVARLAVSQICHERGRTVLVVLAIALAVLAVTLLSSLGLGVMQTGEERFDRAGQDVWISGDSVELTATGSLENPITDSHRLATDLNQRDDVETASPLAFHSVYVGTKPDNTELVTGVGVPGTGSDNTADGDGFSGGDSHYANGSYDGPMSQEIVIDPQTAELFDVGVGDTIYVGTSRVSAPEREFEIVGISSEYSQFLGTSTVTMPISELQELAGTTGTDRATFVTVTTVDGADRETVSEDIQQSYPGYNVRTSEEQFESMLNEYLLVLASGATLVVLALVAGIALTTNTLVLVAVQQRDELAALRALGLSRGLIAGVIGGQGFTLGVLGGILGLLSTPLFAFILNHIATSFVGFENLLRTPPIIYATGLLIAVAIGTLGAVIAGWRAARYARVDNLYA